MHDTELVSPAVYDDNLLRITRNGPSTARLAGEIDHSNRLRIKTLLETMLDQTLRSHSAPTDVVLDLSSLRFLDVAGRDQRGARRGGVPQHPPAAAGRGAARGCCACSTGAAPRSRPSWWSSRTRNPVTRCR